MSDEIQKEEGKVETPQFSKPLEKMTVKELREVAKDIPGVQGVTAMKKDELVQILKSHYGIQDEAPAKTRTKKPKLSMTVTELKAKIAVLREEKEVARAEKDRNKINILRRRINRFKRLSRKVARA